MPEDIEPSVVLSFLATYHQWLTVTCAHNARPERSARHTRLSVPCEFAQNVIDSVKGLGEDHLMAEKQVVFWLQLVCLYYSSHSCCSTLLETFDPYGRRAKVFMEVSSHELAKDRVTHVQKLCVPGQSLADMHLMMT